MEHMEAQRGTERHGEKGAIEIESTRKLCRARGARAVSILDDDDFEPISVTAFAIYLRVSVYLNLYQCE